MITADAIRVLEAERQKQGIGFLELLIDCNENRSKYETNTKAIILLAADQFIYKTDRSSF